MGDRTLMPDFPGIEKAEHPADWDTAFPLTYNIRPKDDDYWREHRGTPKAFVTLAAGKRMWANRFGEVTAIRFPMPDQAVGDDVRSLAPSDGRNARVEQALHEAGARPHPLPLPRGEGARRAGEGIRAVHGPDARPLLEVEASHEPGLAGTAQSTVPAGFQGRTGTAKPASEPPHAGSYRAGLERRILANLDPAALGLRFESVREQALKAAAESQDFGGLFIGFSLFLIVAALILMALLFQFGLEQRSSEVGTLLALGFTPRRVRRLLLGEGAVLAFIGGLIGTLAGLAYARLMLLGLTTVWRDAVGGTTLKFFVTPGSLVIGLTASTLVAVLTLRLALRKQSRLPAVALLTSDFGFRIPDFPTDVGWEGRIARVRRLVRVLTNVAALGIASLVGAFGLVGTALATGETTNAGLFFGAGALVLIGGLAMFAWRLGRVRQGPAARSPASDGAVEASLSGLRLNSLALRGAARRRSRSVATAALLASGSFLILSLGVFRLDATRDAMQRTSGTGGFALIGEATLPVAQDLNTRAGRESFAFEEPELEGVRFVPFRVRAGDEASCLNLNRAQKPRLLGVKPEAMEGRFTVAKGQGWEGLKSEIRSSKSEVPAIGDAASIQWAMGRKVGDTIDYLDDRGRPFKVRIVGAVANSILQGNLIIEEAEFVKRFPDQGGYQYFLIDARANRRAALSGLLSRALKDHGLEVTPTERRLNQFNAVQNTYLGTFQILGGLGLLLGSAGLGIVVLRNVLERRGELAVLLAVGFRKPTIERWVLVEHAVLLGSGLAIGLLAAGIAVLPALISPGWELPYASLVPTLLAVLANGMVWTWAATRAAVRGNLLEALRNE